MTAAEAIRSDGRCHVNLDADGARITHLSAHVDGATVMRVFEYPAESRVVLNLGDRSTGSVAVFLPAAELARLIDVLNASYTRVVRRSRAEEPTDSGAP